MNRNEKFIAVHSENVADLIRNREFAKLVPPLNKAEVEQVQKLARDSLSRTGWQLLCGVQQ
jgi:hypothetical protein